MGCTALSLAVKHNGVYWGTGDTCEVSEAWRHVHVSSLTSRFQEHLWIWIFLVKYHLWGIQLEEKKLQCFSFLIATRLGMKVRGWIHITWKNLGWVTEISMSWLTIPPGFHAFLWSMYRPQFRQSYWTKQRFGNLESSVQLGCTEFDFLSTWELFGTMKNHFPFPLLSTMV